jgi:hypothetical protein
MQGIELALIVRLLTLIVWINQKRSRSVLTRRDNMLS